MECKCKHPKYHKKDNDKTGSLWCMNCENKVEDERNEDDDWDYYYKEMDFENDCTCGSYTKDGLKIADCIC